MKLHQEGLLEKIEVMEREKKEAKLFIQKLQEELIDLKNSNQRLLDDLYLKTNESKQIKSMYESYEKEFLNKVPELENKIRVNKKKYEKELKDIEAFYKDKLKKQEEKLRKNTSNSNVKNKYSTINHSNTNQIPNNTTNNFNTNNYFEYEIDFRDKNEIKQNNKNNPMHVRNNSNTNLKNRTGSNFNSKADNYIKINPASNSRTIEDDFDRVNV